MRCAEFDRGNMLPGGICFLRDSKWKGNAMKENLRNRLRRLLLGIGVGLTLSLLSAAAGWCQQAPPPAPDASGATDAAKGAEGDAKGAEDQKVDEAKGAKGASESDPFDRPGDDAAKGDRDTARNASKGAKGAADDASKGARDTAREASEGATDTARDAAGRASRNVREPGRQLPDAGRDRADDARDSARERFEGARDSRDLRSRERDELREPGREGRDITRQPRDSAREALDDARDATRDSARDLRDDFRDTRNRAREFDRDSRDDARDSREFSRGSRESTREFDRDLRDDARSSREFSRDTLRGSREGVRDTDRDLRADTRGTRESSRESVRSSSRGDLNFRAEDIRPADIGLWFGRSTTDGLVISDIATSGPLASTISQIGFREGDRIISVDGYRVASDSDFVRYLFADEVLNQEVPVVVWRDGRRVSLNVEPITLVDRMQTVQHDPLEQFGIVLDDRYDDRVVVWKVLPRSPAFYSGLRAGDVITTFRGERINSPQAFTQIVERVEPGEVAMEVNRNQRVRQIDVDWPQLRAGTTARSALRPEIDDPGIERFSERREERLESRRLPTDDTGGYVAPRTYSPGPVPAPVRRGLLPRLRGR